MQTQAVFPIPPRELLMGSVPLEFTGLLQAYNSWISGDCWMAGKEKGGNDKERGKRWREKNWKGLDF